MMRLCRLDLENFRCFSSLSIDVNEKQIVLIGANGAGKSAVLDAAALALGSYLAGIDGLQANAIQSDDVMERMYFLGSLPTREPIYPVKIEAVANFGHGKAIEWSRTLNHEGGRTTVKGARPIMDFAAELQQRVRQADSDVILPLVAYYGTGRLWNQKQTRSQKKKIRPNESRFKGYADCLTASTDEKRMLQWFSRMTYAQLQSGSPIPELQAVEKAMADCYAGIDKDAETVNVQFDVKTDQLELVVRNSKKRDAYLPLRLLSDGLRTILNMVADIAYRMAVLNPQLLGDALRMTDGVVLIDEIDMHLHPAWQKRILGDLSRIFPKLQFIVTTHAPSVLVNVPKENIRILENGAVYEALLNTYGREISAVLRETMQADVVPTEVRQAYRQFYQAIDQGNLAEAEQILEQIREIVGADDENVMEAQFSLDMERDV